jgi:hypothetical protein
MHKWYFTGPSGRASYCLSRVEMVGSDPTGGVDYHILTPTLLLLHLAENWKNPDLI